VQYTGNYADAIVEVGTLESNGSFDYNGTGFIIGSNKVVTNTHVVYNNVQQWNDCNAIRVNGTTYPISYEHILQSHYTESNEYKDFALLKIYTTVDLDTTYGGINVGVATDDMLNNTSKLMAVAGYPSDLYSNATGANNLYIAYGNFLPTTHDNDSVRSWSLQYTADFYGGQSGSPVFYDKDGNQSTTSDLTAVGVNFGSNQMGISNSGVRFTPQHLKFFFNNTNF
jgi:V8-like Glu-specific endopeptidase